MGLPKGPREDDNNTPRPYERRPSVSQGPHPSPVPILSSADAVRSSSPTDSSSRLGTIQQLFEHNNAQTNKEGFNIRCQSRDPSPHAIGVCLPSQEHKFEGSPMIEEILDCSMAMKQFWQATRYPPITKVSLSELDISSIISNPKLRHDVNFDRELHFRPNLDGQKGLLKREAQRGYWVAVTAELQLYQHMCGPFGSQAAEIQFKTDCSQRIPIMFDAVKQILKNLVPDRDQPGVEEYLDVQMIIQEIGKGVCDFIKLAAWIAQLLKRHCAPMRDEMVDRMVEKIQQGDASSISTGLCELFGVLEAMKLDVANHQIRHLRPLLIGDSISFEQKYHASRMKRRRYNIAYARAWYLNGRKSLNRVPLDCYGSWANRDVEAFVTAILDSLTPTNLARPWPDTFALDTERLRALKVELQELMHEQIYCTTLGKLVNHRKSPGITTDLQLASLGAEIQRVTSDGRLSGLPRGNVIAELVRLTFQITSSSELYDSELEDKAEGWIQEALDVPETLQKHVERFMLGFSRELLQNVEKYLTSSPWDIFNCLVAPTPSTQPSIFPSLSLTGLPVPLHIRRTDIINRITHIAVLHWRIWENLVYNNEEFDQRSGSSQELESRSPSPMVVPRNPHPQQSTGQMPSQNTSNDIDPPVAGQTATPTRP